jgi:hypothetical protein
MVLADASFFLALANSADRFHAQAVRALEATEEGLVTTWPVLAELSHLLVSRLGVTAQLRFLGGAKLMGLRYVELRGEHWPRLLQLMRKYADLPMDLADASLVLAAEELGDGRILSTDQRDFGVYRWKNRKPFRNLLLEA